MFLIPPNVKSPSNQTFRSRHETPEVPVRVKKACDRCRLKKIKCDGRKPCRRCTHDNIYCNQSRRATTNAKALSREYILSLETQQTHLFNALWQLCLRDPDSDGQDVQKILERLKMHGIDLHDLNIECEKSPRHQSDLQLSSVGASEATGAMDGVDTNGTDGLFTTHTDTAEEDRPISVNTALGNFQTETVANIPNTWGFGCATEQSDNPFSFAPPSNGANLNLSETHNQNFSDQWWQNWIDIAEEPSNTDKLNDIGVQT